MYVKEEYILKIKPKPPLFKTSYSYKYNGKEYQDELGLNWFDYGWRNYDPAISRWVNMDPLLNDLDFAFDDSKTDEDDEDEVYESLVKKIETGGGVYNVDNLNPYGYGYNNPVSFDDPDGRCPICPWIDAVVDVGFVLYDVGVLAHEKITTGKTTAPNWAALGADGASIAVPMSVGAGLAVRTTMKAANKVDKTADVVKVTNKVKAKNINEAAEKGIPKIQLGPSGKPKVHTVSKPNQKQAKDAARNNPKSNSKPVKHSSDKGQKTHYHATKNGQKMSGKDNIHYKNRASKKNPK